jgi:hypothetical protein
MLSDGVGWCQRRIRAKSVGAALSTARRTPFTEVLRKPTSARQSRPRPARRRGQSWVESGRLVAVVSTRLGSTVSLEPDPVIEAFKKDIDRTLLRQNLTRTVEERLRNLIELQRFARELVRAGRKARDDRR